MTQEMDLSYIGFEILWNERGFYSTVLCIGILLYGT